MKKLKYFMVFLLSMTILTSCFKEDTELLLNDQGINVVTFDRTVDHLTGVAEDGGAEYTFMKKIKLVGPSVSEITSTITVDVAIAEGTTADGTMYTINNLPITLSPANNYLAEISMTLTTLGNEPPKEGSPEEATYVAPVLNLDLVATGDPKVTASGKTGQFTLNFTPRNIYAGEYTAHLFYRHPSLGTYPDNVYVEEDNIKTLTGVTARKAEVSGPVAIFATWTDLCWITINSDNSATLDVADTWPYDVKMGDPNRADFVSHWDPATGIIYLYYHYSGSGGDRIFWETFTPNWDYVPE
jgi:hypothetical protein